MRPGDLSLLHPFIMELKSFESPSTDLITVLQVRGGKRKQDKWDTWGRRIIEEHNINFLNPLCSF